MWPAADCGCRHSARKSGASHVRCRTPERPGFRQTGPWPPTLPRAYRVVTATWLVAPLHLYFETSALNHERVVLRLAHREADSNYDTISRPGRFLKNLRGQAI